MRIRQADTNVVQSLGYQPNGQTQRMPDPGRAATAGFSGFLFARPSTASQLFTPALLAIAGLYFLLGVTVTPPHAAKFPASPGVLLDQSESAREQRTGLVSWALLAYPSAATNQFRTAALPLGNDVLDREIIAVHEDPLHVQGRVVIQEMTIEMPAAEHRAMVALPVPFGPPEFELWLRPLAGGDTAIGIFNRTPRVREFSFKWSELGQGIPVRVRDLWSQTNRLVSGDLFTSKLDGYDALMLRAANRAGKGSGAD